MKYIVIICLVIILSSCGYSYKIRYLDNRSVEVIYLQSPNYYVGDTLSVSTKYDEDYMRLVNTTSSRKAVIIPLTK